MRDIERSARFSWAQRAFIDVTRVVLRIFFKVFYGVKAKGGNRIPLDGPVLVAPNHLSYLDPPLVGAYLDRDLIYMAADYLFKVPLFRQLIMILGAFPIKQGANQASAYKTALRVLQNGEPLIMFPEGTRSETGDPVVPLQEGVARLALQTGAAILPVSIYGAYEAYNRKMKYPRFFCPIRIIYHNPIFVEKTTDKEEARKRQKEITDILEKIFLRAHKHKYKVLGKNK